MNDAAVNVALKFVDQATAPMKNALGKIDSQTKRSAVSLNSIVQSINKAYYTLLAFGAVSSIAAPFTKGIQAADEFRLTTIGVASTLTDMAKKSNRSMESIYAQNLKYAQETYQKVEMEAAKWFASGEEMVQAWQILTQKGVIVSFQEDIRGLGIITDKIKLLTQGQASSLQIATELRAAMDGEARAGAQLAKILEDRIGPSWKDQLKTAAEQGRVIAWMSELFQGLLVASKDIERTIESQGNRLKTIIKVIGRTGLGGAYDDIVESISKMNDYLEANRDAISGKIADIWRDIKGVVTDPELTKFFGSILSSGADSIKSMVAPLSDIYKSLQQIVSAYNSLPAEVTGPMGTGIIFRLLTGSTTVGMLATLNSLLDKSNRSLQGLFRTSKDISEQVGAVWDVARGARDAQTGEWNLPPGSIKKPIPKIGDDGRVYMTITPPTSPARIVAPAIDQDTESMKKAKKAAEELKKALQKLEETRAKAITSAREDIYGKFQEGAMDAGIRTGGIYNAMAESAYERHTEILKEGLDVYREMRTPIEQYREELDKLTYLLGYGAINQETFNRASRDLADQFDETRQKAKAVAGDIQQHLGSGLYNALKGDFDNIGAAFTDMLLRMIAEAQAAQLAKWMFGDLAGGTGSGWFGSALTSIIGLFGGGGGSPENDIGLFGSGSSMAGGSTAGGGVGTTSSGQIYRHAKGDYWFTEPTAAVGLRTGKRHMIAEAGQPEYLAGPNPQRSTTVVRPQMNVKFIVDPNLKMRVEEGPTVEEVEKVHKTIWLRAVTSDENFRTTASSFLVGGR